MNSTPILAAKPAESGERSKPAYQPAEPSATLRELGIPDGMRLQGAAASGRLYLPSSPLQRPRSLQLQLQFAPAMPTGKLWIESNHQVLAEEVIPRGTQSTWSIPLTGLNPVNGQIPLQIHLSVDNPNVCQALAGDWMRVTPESRVLYQANSTTSLLPTINQFFPGYLQSVYPESVTFL